MRLVLLYRVSFNVGINVCLTMRLLSAMLVDFLSLPPFGLPPGLNSVSRSLSNAETEDMEEELQKPVGQQH